ncbi:hypothetical protein L917_21738 [Phytophthora nicotianae]|uniref:Uncharacterized protein n=1 Tax=Phytophthora nicotianae TaxID=4792 RepID=W2JWN3_PHYNI|nr:hypothetical protein L917_21738 [Phytophthora nicotianae]
MDVLGEISPVLSPEAPAQAAREQGRSVVRQVAL